MSKKVLGLILLAIWGFSFSVVEAQSGAFFGVSPTKLEANLKSGEVSSQTITVLNKLGGPARFTLSLESFYPGKGGQGIEIKSAQDDIIKKYISFDNNSFVLADGESIIVPVSIRLAPTEIAPSAFGVISIEGKPLNAAQGAARVSSRLGVLVFINASAKAQPK
ncbi:MAG: hypothetical protein QG665_531 [Patescibacteria group bacterium]|nr:hypothetical protein [Patescibacteria group bacterium]